MSVNARSGSSGPGAQGRRADLEARDYARYQAASLNRHNTLKSSLGKQSSLSPVNEGNIIKIADDVYQISEMAS